MGKQQKTESVKIADLKLNDSNRKQHDLRSKSMKEKRRLIIEVGVLFPITISKDNFVLAGDDIFLIAKSLGHVYIQAVRMPIDYEDLSDFMGSSW